MHNQSAPITLQITVNDADQTALELLAQRSGLSKQRIKDAMNKGAVWCTQKNKTLRLRRATKRLSKGVIVQLYYDATLLALTPPAAELITDASGYSVWFKPHHMLAQGSQWGDHCSLLRWTELHLSPVRPAFLVHRLDADAAGLMLIAHNQKAAAQLSNLFQNRQIHKHYQAWIEGQPGLPSEGLTLNQSLDDKDAVSHVRFLDYDEEKRQTLVEVKIDTGRKHQIRRHLANWGHPIIGDKLYGKASAHHPLQLLAFRLEFECPIHKKNQCFELPAERQFRKQLSSII